MRAFPFAPGTPPRRAPEHRSGAEPTATSGDCATPDNSAELDSVMDSVLAKAAASARRVAATAAATTGGSDSPEGESATGSGSSAISAGSNTRSAQSDNSGQRPAARRLGLLTCAASLVFSIAVVFAPSASAAPSPAFTENPGARHAVAESTATQPDPTAIPADFATEAGYRPTIEAGLLVNPDGGCSSPVPLPEEFELACRAHDLGYDLLRYADSHGQPLGPWARQSLDAALEQRMHQSCETRSNALSRSRCQFMASVANTFVDLNSTRQNYGTPVHEALFDEDIPASVRTAMAIGLILAGSLTAALILRRTARRNSARSVSK